MLLIEFKCSILKKFSLEIVHTNCSKMASSVEIKIIGVTGCADAKMPTTKNIERQMFSVGDPISQKNSTSGFTLDGIPCKTK